MTKKWWPVTRCPWIRNFVIKVFKIMTVSSESGNLNRKTLNAVYFVEYDIRFNE